MAEGGDSSTENDGVPGQVKAIWCQPCLNKDKQTKASKYCASCDEFQCSECLNVHYTFAFMKGHEIVNKNEARKKKVYFDMKGLDNCYQHQKVVEYFCEDENQLCCSTCAIFDHHKCNSIVNVQTVAGKSTSKTSSLKGKLQEVKQRAEVVINNIVSSKEKLDADVKEISLKIRRMRDKVIKMFDELEVDVVRKAELFQTETLEKLTKKQLQNEKHLADIQLCLETIDCVHQNGTSVQQFIVDQKMQKELNILQKKVNTECQSLETFTVTFDFDELLKLPPQSVIDYVPGKLTVKSNLQDAASIINPDSTKVTLTPLISTNLKQSDDDLKEPLYTGIDFLPDGRLIAVENKNKKCLLYNEKLEKVGSLQLSYNPKCVVAISEQEVAITYGKEYKIDILRVNKSNQISLDKTFKVTTQYFSICLKDDGHFVVGTINHSTPFCILSFTGEEKDFNITFPKKKYPNDSSVCIWIRNSDKVVLTDRYEHTVYIYDLKRNTRVLVKDDRMKEPFGAAVGPSDTILICCRITNAIIQISQTGLIISSFIIDMKYPSSICVSRDKSFLVVSNSCKGSKKLQKLKISL